MSKFFIISFLFVSMLFSQNYHDWQVITSLNNIQQIHQYQDEIWVATTGGAYVFDLNDSSAIAHDNLDGLASLSLVAVDSDDKENIVFAAKNGILSVYNKSADLWTNDNSLNGQSVRDIHIIGDTLWIATDNGVGVFLYKNNSYEFRDFFGNFPIIPGSGSDIIWYYNKIYFGTENGLLSAPANFLKYNLKSTENWLLIENNEIMPLPSVQTMTIIDDTLTIGLSASAARLDKNGTLYDGFGWIYGLVQNIVAVDDTIFFMRAKSISYYANNKWGFYKSSPVPINFANNVDGKLWLGTETGLLKINWEKIFKIDGPAYTHVGIVIKDRKDNLWATSSKFKLTFKKGFYKYSSGAWTNYNFSGDYWQYKGSPVYMYETQDGQIWGATWNGGIFIIEDSLMQYIHPHNKEGELIISTTADEIIQPLSPIPADLQNCLSPSSENDQLQVITYLTEDETGNLWLSNFIAETSEFITMIPRQSDGKLNMDCESWLHFGKASNLQFSAIEGEISCLEFDDFGRLWIGTFQAGILVYDFNGTYANSTDDKLYRIGISDNLFSVWITAIAKDKDGVMWIGTDAGLNSYDGVNFYKHIGDTGPVENKVNQIFVDDYNNKWISTDGGLTVLRSELSPWESNAWIDYTTDNSGLPNNIVNSVFVDAESGKSYIATENGLAIFKGTFAEYKDNLDLISGGPNPFILNSNSHIFTIKNLMPNSTVKILNINGMLVRTLTIENNGISGSRANWNGKDDDGEKVSSGVYIYLVYTEEGIVGKGKISLINP